MYNYAAEERLIHELGNHCIILRELMINQLKDRSTKTSRTRFHIEHAYISVTVFLVVIKHCHRTYSASR